MSVSDEAKVAILALAIHAIRRDEQTSSLKSERLSDAIGVHYLFAKASNVPFIEAAGALLDTLKDDEVIPTLAPRVPKEHAKSTFQLVVAALAGDGFLLDWELAHWRQVGDALGLSQDERRQLGQRIVDTLGSQHGPVQIDPPKSVSDDAQRAIIAIMTVVSAWGGEPSEGKPQRIARHLLAHPLFVGVKQGKFQRLTKDAVKEVERLEVGPDGLIRLAARVPKELGPAAYELAVQGAMADHALSELDFALLLVLSQAFGLSPEQTIEINNRATQDHRDRFGAEDGS